MNKLTKGFTLIELLVVIAIIGILSSVVLSSLNAAREKGADAAIKSNLAGMRAQSGIVYEANNSSFAALCSDPTVVAAIESAENAAGVATSTLNTTLATAGSTGVATCHAGTNAWAIEIPLKSDPAGFFCVDSASIAVNTSGSTLAGDDTTCN